jgi:hypothetical protein
VVFWIVVFGIAVWLTHGPEQLPFMEVERPVLTLGY